MEIQLRTSTPSDWVDVVLSNFDSFLVDHAACERKASATGVNFVVQYPDRKLLIEPMLRFAREELEHFHQVCRFIVQRNLQLAPDVKDHYVTALLGHIRGSGEKRLLDRLIVFGLVEARGCERFHLLSQHLKDEEFKAFYLRLAQAESRHHQLFISIAESYFSEAEIQDRLNFLTDFEAELVRSLPFRAAVH